MVFLRDVLSVYSVKNSRESFKQNPLFLELIRGVASGKHGWNSNVGLGLCFDRTQDPTVLSRRDFR